MLIARSVLAEVLAHAATTPGEEVCGLLFGDAGRIARAAPAINVAADRRCLFEIDPRALLAAHKAERAGGPTLVGHYHSHPGGLPIPSPTDAAAAEPGRLWLIIGGGAARLWRAGIGGHFVEEDMIAG